jgi:hypothetical protein
MSPLLHVLVLILSFLSSLIKLAYPLCCWGTVLCSCHRTWHPVGRVLWRLSFDLRVLYLPAVVTSWATYLLLYPMTWWLGPLMGVDVGVWYVFNSPQWRVTAAKSWRRMRDER